MFRKPLFSLLRMPFCLAPLLGALFCFGVSSNVAADAPLEGTKPAHWRVTWNSDPATSATISWSTAESGSQHTLRYRVKGSDQDEGVVAAISGRFTGGQVELYYHHVRLTDLKPSTNYEVQMTSDGEASPVFYFLTAPDNDRPFSMMHGGDSRSDQKERRSMNQMMSQMLSRSFANEDPADDILALAHGGDYIVSGPNVAQWSMWLSDHELTVTEDNRLLPVIPARGNHDRGKPFNEVFGFPDDDPNYYAIDITPAARFVTLNTEISTAGDQAQWLEKELASSRAQYRWLVAQYHTPVFPAVKGPSSALQSWVPLFEKYDVDLVCEADGHNIKRTVPIRDGKHDESGVVYIGEGGLGVGQRTPKTDRWFLQSPGMADKGSHVFLLTFGEEAIEGKCVLLGGEVRDRFRRPWRAAASAAN
ncbi:Calcineurin-like phosphoesterase [Novipirellula galeiformis]|uniref:Calcineurin-like phosphoesterase n=1 Tax=Novipirellula galeiformis TaxID=2528004 RepID=A0A5C6CBV2_9BACT|nr:metallophosphoesterase family protein [Novipirellula galeiformis]TWU22253.1 Calcineurin-like phosphoesterase [Novipirellula galeiformis]